MANHCASCGFLKELLDSVRADFKAMERTSERWRDWSRELRANLQMALERVKATSNRVAYLEGALEGIALLSDAEMKARINAVLAGGPGERETHPEEKSCD